MNNRNYLLALLFIGFAWSVNAMQQPAVAGRNDILERLRAPAEVVQEVQGLRNYIDLQRERLGNLRINWAAAWEFSEVPFQIIGIVAGLITFAGVFLAIFPDKKQTLDDKVGASYACAYLTGILSWGISRGCVKMGKQIARWWPIKYLVPQLREIADVKKDIRAQTAQKDQLYIDYFADADRVQKSLQPLVLQGRTLQQANPEQNGATAEVRRVLGRGVNVIRRMNRRLVAQIISRHGNVGE